MSFRSVLELRITQVRTVTKWLVTVLGAVTQLITVYGFLVDPNSQLGKALPMVSTAVPLLVSFFVWLLRNTTPEEVDRTLNDLFGEEDTTTLEQLGIQPYSTDTSAIPVPVDENGVPTDLMGSTRGGQ